MSAGGRGVEWGDLWTEHGRGRAGRASKEQANESNGFERMWVKRNWNVGLMVKIRRRKKRGAH